MLKVNLAIIGSGPAAYTAAIYAARAGIDLLLFSGFQKFPAGGQLMTTTAVENFPGFPEGVLGADLMEKCKKQAVKYGTKIIAEDVESVDFKKKPFLLKGSKTEIEADSVIVATGASAKKLNIPGAEKFWQKGVSSCAVCDGALPLFKNKPIFVIGGGDSAAEEALFLTKFASRVCIVHRREKLKASPIMAKRVQNHPKIEILWNSELIEIAGQAQINEVVLKNVNTGKTEKKPAGGVFFAIGHQPNTGFLQGQLKLNTAGYIEVEKGRSQTSLEGVFAAGDVHDYIYRQAITAAGSGCKAALDAEKWLSAKGFLQQ